MKIIIAGSRGFSNYSKLEREVDLVLADLSEDERADLEIQSGGAVGADKLGEDYAKNHGIPCRVHPADWETYGTAAGFVRNEAMAKVAEGGILIAFWDSVSRGTKHMIAISKRHNIKAYVIRY